MYRNLLVHTEKFLFTEEKDKEGKVQMEITIVEIKNHWNDKTKPMLENAFVTLKHDINLTRCLEKILNCVDSKILVAEQEEGFEFNTFEQIPELCLVLRPTITVITAQTYKDHTKDCTEDDKKLITKLGDELSMFFKLVQYAPIKKDPEEMKRPRLDNDQAVTTDDVYGTKKEQIRRNYNFNV